jgi:surface antigen
MTAFSRCGALLLVLFSASLPAGATNLAFLKEAPISRFTKQDMKLFEQALNDALEKSADGEAKTWSNPDTQAGGEIKTIKSFKRGAMPCRSLVIRNSAKGLTASGEYSLCKQPKGEWKQASSEGA